MPPSSEEEEEEEEERDFSCERKRAGGMFDVAVMQAKKPGCIAAGGS